VNILKRNKRSVITIAVTLLCVMITFLVRDVIFPALSAASLPLLTQKQVNAYYPSIIKERPDFKYKYLDYLFEHSKESPADIEAVYTSSSICLQVFRKEVSLHSLFPEYTRKLNDEYFYTVLKSKRVDDGYFWYSYLFFERYDGYTDNCRYTGISLCVPPVMHSRAQAEKRIEELYADKGNKECQLDSSLWYRCVLGYNGNYIFGEAYNLSSPGFNRDLTQYHLLTDCILRIDTDGEGQVKSYKLMDDSEFFPECADEIEETLREIRNTPQLYR